MRSKAPAGNPSDVPSSQIDRCLPFAEGGMRKKLHYIREALAAGVKSVWLRNGWTASGGQPNGTRFHVD